MSPFYFNVWEILQHLVQSSGKDCNKEEYWSQMGYVAAAANGGILLKKGVLKFSQNSQENTFTRVSFLIT